VLPTVCAGTSEKSGQLVQDVEKEEGILQVDYSASSHTPVIPEGYPEQLRRIALGLGHGHGQRTLVAQRQKEMLLESKEGGEEDADADADAANSTVTVEDDDGTTTTAIVNDSDSDETGGNFNPADATTELEPLTLCDDAERPIPKNQLEFLEMAAAAIEENFGYRFDNLKMLREVGYRLVLLRYLLVLGRLLEVVLLGHDRTIMHRLIVNIFMYNLSVTGTDPLLCSEPTKQRKNGIPW
jgi:hypothetical protein